MCYVSGRNYTGRMFRLLCSSSVRYPTSHLFPFDANSRNIALDPEQHRLQERNVERYNSDGVVIRISTVVWDRGVSAKALMFPLDAGVTARMRARGVVMTGYVKFLGRVLGFEVSTGGSKGGRESVPVRIRSRLRDYCETENCPKYQSDVSAVDTVTNTGTSLFRHGVFLGELEV